MILFSRHKQPNNLCALVTMSEHSVIGILVTKHTPSCDDAVLLIWVGWLFGIAKKLGLRQSADEQICGYIIFDK